MLPRMQNRDATHGRLGRCIGRGLALLLTLTHLALPSPALAEDVLETPGPSTGAIVFDALVLRPTGLVVAMVGMAFFVPAALLASPGGSRPVSEARDYFVRTPADFLTARPLGEF
jgi:hypothetical protein